jgi:polyhydroxybutyrate depolymerase
MTRFRIALIIGVVVLLLGYGLKARVEADDLPSEAKPGRFSVVVSSGGYDRQAEVVIPKVYEAGKKLPLVLLFHGAGGSGASMLDANRWAAKAEKEGFIAVAPNGLAARPRLASSFAINPQVWNSGQLNPDGPRAKIDDVAYVRTLLDDLQKRIGFDERKVFAAGHSNGGGMSFVLANEMSDRVRAIAPVSCILSIDEPKPERPVPTLFILGDADPLVPLAGGEVELRWGKKTNPPVDEFLARWAKGLGCAETPALISESDQLKRSEYRSANGGPSLKYVLIKGQGHGWAGGSRLLPERLVGPRSDALSATDAAWEFFQEASRQP